MDQPEIVAALRSRPKPAAPAHSASRDWPISRAVRAATKPPIIGLIKRDVPDTPIIITATIADVEALAEAGADIIAFDATLRDRPDASPA